MMRQVRLSPIRHKIQTGLFLLLLLSCATRLNVALWNLDVPWVQPPAEGRGKIDPIFFKFISFGQLPGVIDWLFLTTLADPGMSKTPKGSHPALFYGLDLISDLDRAFFEVYQAGANLLAVLRGDAEGARDLLLKGNAFVKQELPTHSEEFQNRFWSNAWNVPMLLGYVYLFQLEDMPHAAEAFRQSAELPNCPAYIVRMEQRLSRPGGEYEVGLRLLNFMLSVEKDDRVKERLEKKRLNLFVSQYVFELGFSFEKFLKQQPGYLSQSSLSSRQMDSYWRNFLRTSQISKKDPWGGSLYLDTASKVMTTTAHEPVFGLK